MKIYSINKEVVKKVNSKTNEVEYRYYKALDVDFIKSCKAITDIEQFEQVFNRIAISDAYISAVLACSKLDDNDSSKSAYIDCIADFKSDFANDDYFHTYKELTEYVRRDDNKFVALLYFAMSKTKNYIYGSITDAIIDISSKDITVKQDRTDSKNLLTGALDSIFTLCPYTKDWKSHITDNGIVNIMKYINETYKVTSKGITKKIYKYDGREISFNMYDVSRQVILYVIADVYKIKDGDNVIK